MTTEPTIKAVIFDIGGVVVGSPIVGAGIYEKKHNLPYHYINVAITARGHNGAFQRMERGEIELNEFYQTFGTELSDVERSNNAYRVYSTKLKKDCPPLPTSLDINGEELWDTMMTQATMPDLTVLTAINLLRASGKYTVAALTNNFKVPKDATPPAPKSARPSSSTPISASQLQSSYESSASNSSRKGSPTEMLKLLFDEFFESALIGLRKPDPRFYEYALEKLGIQPEEAVFLDDIGINLVAARKLGIHTIRVLPGKSLEAVKELERYVGINLIENAKL